MYVYPRALSLFLPPSAPFLTQSRTLRFNTVKFLPKSTFGAKIINFVTGQRRPNNLNGGPQSFIGSPGKRRACCTCNCHQVAHQTDQQQQQRLDNVNTAIAGFVEPIAASELAKSKTIEQSIRDKGRW